jgi:NAD(P)H-hydrate repair Nnr-like enzyme with NAD(P)H-hydrate dehydratase domain
VTQRLLRGWPLPQLSDDADKEGRGRVLVVAGAPELPGTAILAATAALRSGAGKLRIATVASIAPHLGIAVPEARVFALPEAKGGAIDPDTADRLVELHALPTPAILTPHAGEMAGLLGIEKTAVLADPVGTARRAAEHFRAVVALKGSQTVIATPGGEVWRNRSGNVGLATSGSGDTLSGIIAGLVARGAAPAQATIWGVHLHGSAGDRLAKRVGPLGYLARELLAEIPALMAELSRPTSERSRAARPSARAS